MLASGNSNPLVCVANLLRTVRGEVPYDRLLGVDPDYIDQASSLAVPEMMIDMEWLIETYEPRVDVVGFERAAIDAEKGIFKIEPKVQLKAGDDE